MRRTSGKHDAFRVDTHGVDNSAVATKIEYKGSFRAFPFLDVIAAR